MKTRWHWLIALFLAACLPLVHGHSAEPKKVDELMRKKLEASQKVLEGIAVNDFQKIGANAETLIEISKAAEWKVHKTAQYEVNSNEFRRNAESLILAAKTKNIDAASLAYVEMTLTCVRCHKHVREVRMGRLDVPPSLPLADARPSRD